MANFNHLVNNIFGIMHQDKFDDKRKIWKKTMRDNNNKKEALWIRVKNSIMTRLHTEEEIPKTHPIITIITIFSPSLIAL